MSFTYQTKSTSTFSNLSKNTSTFSNIGKSLIEDSLLLESGGYLFQESGYKILLSDPALSTWANQTKS